MLIIDPRKGKVNDVEGMRPIAWSPGGRRLLAVGERFSGYPQPLREVWFSGGGVANRDIGEIPPMQVGYGTWRTGIPVPLCKDCSEQLTLEKDY